MAAFIFTHPNFANVEGIGWWREALTFAVEVKFTDGATVKGSLSGVGFQVLYDKAEAARGDVVRKTRLFEISLCLFIFSADDKKIELPRR